MIRRAAENDFSRKISSESALRVFALKCAYGLDVPFIQYFADENGSLAAIMDEFCVFHCVDELNDEWRLFFTMHTDIAVLHTEEKIARSFDQFGQYNLISGDVLRISRPSSNFTLHEEALEMPPLREVYLLLSNTFTNVPPFDSWYVDVSHRVRHGCCHIVGKYSKNELASVAMTVAETEDIALIGGVATLPSYRGKGLASSCITDLISRLPQETVLIAPSSVEAAQLYQKLGFVPYGTWAEVTLTPQEG